LTPRKVVLEEVEKGRINAKRMLNGENIKGN
jgi:hypothetical protein